MRSGSEMILTDPVPKIVQQELLILMLQIAKKFAMFLYLRTQVRFNFFIFSYFIRIVCFYDDFLNLLLHFYSV